eukprot:12851084-Prorocentrum_lima.AAC.1
MEEKEREANPNYCLWERVKMQCSPGNVHIDWGPAQPKPSFGAGSRDDIDSLKTKEKLPHLDF